MNIDIFNNFKTRYLQLLLELQYRATIPQLVVKLKLHPSHAASYVNILVSDGFVHRLTIGTRDKPAIYCISKSGKLVLSEIKKMIII